MQGSFEKSIPKNSSPKDLQQRQLPPTRKIPNRIQTKALNEEKSV